jgi:hypothetical protein
MHRMQQHTSGRPWRGRAAGGRLLAWCVVARPTEAVLPDGCA